MSEPEIPVQDPTPPTNKIPLHPVPTALDIGTALLGDNQRAVVLSISTPSGIQHYFFDANQAFQVAKSLQRQSRAIMSWEDTHTKKLFVPGEGR